MQTAIIENKAVEVRQTPQRRPWGVEAKLTLSLFVLALVPIGATLTATLATSQPQMERLAKENLQGAVSSFRGSVGQWEEQNHALGRQAAGEIGNFIATDVQGQKRYLESFVKTANGAVVTAWTTDFDGIQLVRDNDGKLSNIAEREYFKEAQRVGASKIDVVFSKSTGKYTTLAGYRYTVPGVASSGATIPPRVLGINWNPDFLKKATDRLSLGKSGRASIVSDDGLFVHATEGKVGGEAEKSLVAKLPSNDENALFEHVSDNGDRWIVAASSDSQRGLRYVVMQLHAEAFGPVETQKAYAVWGAGFAILFALVFAGFVRKTFASPVVDLARALRSLATTAPSDLWQLNIPHVGKPDEIGMAARAAQQIQKIVFAAYRTKADSAIKKGGE